MDGGDVYRTMWMYLMTLNCTLKMIKMIKLMLCIFYHNFKIKIKNYKHVIIYSNIKSCFKNYEVYSISKKQ